jgi:hypothetical protein
MVRLFLVLLVTLSVCYVIEFGFPETPADVKLTEFFEFMKKQLSDLYDLFNVIPDPGIKLAIVGGAALLAVGVVKEIVR